MNRPLLVTALAASAIGMACTALPLGRPPETRISDHVDEYHEIEVADPYRWLEDPESAESQAWVRAQQDYTEAFLDRADARPGIRERLRELWNYTRYGLPVQRGGRTFLAVNDGLQDHSLVYVIEEEGAQPRVVLNPNNLSADGTVAVASWVPSWDGKLLAYAVSEAGSDWRTWRVREVETGRILKDEVEHTKLDDLIWLGNSRGFFYSRYDAPEQERELSALNDRPDIFVHRLGTDQDEDAMVLPRPEEKGVFQSFGLLADRKTLYVTRRDVNTFHNELYVARRPEGVAASQLATGSLELSPLFFGFDASYEYIADDGETCWVLTDRDAPRGRVMTFDLAAQRADLIPSEEEFLLIEEELDEDAEPEPEPEYWTELIPEGEDTIARVSLVDGQLIVNSIRDASSRVQVYDLDGSYLEEVLLPGVGTVTGFESGLEGGKSFYSFSSYLVAPTIYRYDVQSGISEVFRQPRVPIDPNEFETYQVFYRSGDSKQIPMFLTHRKDMPFSGKNPTYLTADGGFGNSLTPFFSIPNLVWLEMGGVLAVANVRGGGEYGADWHEAGRIRNKQTVFDDLSFAARWLIRNEYTTPDKLALGGEFNGGLAVAACITQNPHMYGAALISAGLLDMLRYEEFTIGWTWAGDYGTVQNRWDFHEMLDYSPLHNVQDDCPYPATMVLTADHDDRVVPWHSYKFLATLQAAQGGPEPVLIRIDERAGQGAAKPTYKQIEEATDRLAFLHETLDLSGEGDHHCPESWYH